jgi:molybdopterin converting factor small subunit
MRVTVELQGHLQQYVKDGSNAVEVDIKDGATVGELISQLGVPDEATWNAALDGKLVYNDDLLSDGAVLLLFPPLAGG